MLSRHISETNNKTAFGSGKRTCIGKNISLLEVHKLVPLLLMRFKVSCSLRFSPCLFFRNLSRMLIRRHDIQLRLVDPQKKLHIWNTFFVHQKGLEVYVETA